MKFKVAIKNPRLRSAIGAVLTIACGLLLWRPEDWGQKLVNASYDSIFFFLERKVTNEVVVLLMQSQGHPPKPWDRALHAKLVDLLAAEKCPLVVFDSFFREASDTPADVALASALGRLDRVALMARRAEDEHPRTPSTHALKPAPQFLAATKTNWGVAWFNPDLDGIVRKHWPFPAPDELYESLSWTVAKLAGTKLNKQPQEQWLRYYRAQGPGARFDYPHAFTQASGFFSNKIVFIGNKPATPRPDREQDEFSTPYTRWTGDACGGVDLVVTAFLNLVNQEWLRRPALAVEAGVLVLTGALLGGFLCRLRKLIAFATAAGCAVGGMLGAVTLSCATNYWFPWLVVVAGQVPCALVWAWVTRPRNELSIVDLLEEPDIPKPEPTWDEESIEAADYDVIKPAFAQGAFGRVWLARNAVGQWQALKGVYEARFGNDRTPYELEFKGISNYKPVSDRHPGLLRVDFVSMPKLEGYFYYVMELGDAMAPGWESDPQSYRPLDLASVIKAAKDHRLPVAECVRIVGQLADALDFLHQQGFIHRDVKPSNIIFVNGRPKLADVGLVREIRPAAEVKTWAGTLGYMPPNEPPGTVAADIYALGMVLYVISTGQPPAAFSELSTTLAQVAGPEFIRLNSVILKACDPDRTRRYATAGELCAALAEVQRMCEKAPCASDKTGP